MTRNRKRPIKKAIFIACEGQNTEPNYFERIKEEVEELGALAITVYPDNTVTKPKTDALGLVEVAIEKKKDGFDELWVVFDKDGYTKHEEAFKKAQAEGIHIAFSSIAFEHWVLLHYEQNLTPYAKSQALIDAKLAGGATYFPAYAKSKTTDPYTVLQARTDIAIRNATWLRWKQGALLYKNPIYDLNPITTVDYLVGRLLGKPKYHFTSLGAPIPIEDPKRTHKLVLTFSLSGADACILASNLSDIAVVSNEIFLEIDTGTSIEGVIPPKNTVIEPGKELLLIFNMKAPLAPTATLLCRALEQIVLVPYSSQSDAGTRQI
jgi:hypothetical protein